MRFSGEGMRQMNTYALVKDHPGGISITDAITIQGNRRRPIRLEKAGDPIDLMSVDIDTFTRSAWSGLIRQMFLTGALSAVHQKVPVDRAALFDAAYGKLMETGGNQSGIAGAPVTVQIEPGVQVGVMNVPTMKTELPDVPTPQALQTASAVLEPGVMVPGVMPQTGVTVLEELPTHDGAARVAGQIADGLNAPAKIVDEPKPAKKKKKASKEPSAEEVAAPQEQTETFDTWKANLDFQTQKSRVADSEDKDFLRWVASKDESRQLQKIASARLAELLALEQPKSGG